MSGETGTLYFVTDDNHSAVFGMKNGDVVSMRCKRFQGMDALNAFLSIRSGRYRFVPHSAGLQRGKSQLPPTEELLTILETQHQNQSTDSPASAAWHLSAPREPSLSRMWLADIREIVEVEATEYLGPIASLVCEEIFDEVQPTDNRGIRKVIERISGDIGDPAREAAFKDRVLKRLDLPPLR